MICVLKRDGSIELFDRHKLRGCLLRAVHLPGNDYPVADALASAVECYLHRRGVRCVTSAAVLEMSLTALEAAGLPEARAKLEARHGDRQVLRGRLSIRHANGARSAWSKNWLVHQACRQWGLQRATARIFAGQVEDALMARTAPEIGRSAALRLLARALAAYGLAGPEQPAPAVG